MKHCIERASRAVPALECSSYLQGIKGVTTAFIENSSGVHTRVCQSGKLGGALCIQRRKANLAYFATPSQGSHQAQRRKIVAQFSGARSTGDSHSRTGEGPRCVVDQRGRTLVNPLKVIDNDERRFSIGIEALQPIYYGFKQATAIHCSVK